MYVCVSEIFKPLRALCAQPAAEKRRSEREHKREQCDICLTGNFAVQHEHIRQDKDHRRGPPGEQGKDDLRTLLDDVDLIRPDKIHIVQTDVQREVRREEHKRRAAERHEKSGGKSGAKSDRRAYGGKDRIRRGEEELHAAFGA